MIIDANDLGVRSVDKSNIHVLVYDGSEIIIVQFHNGQVTTKYNLEIFDTTQLLVDRVLELELNFNLGHILLALEAGVNISKKYKDKLQAEVWSSNNLEWIGRAEKLGYENIENIGVVHEAC